MAIERRPIIDTTSNTVVNIIVYDTEATGPGNSWVPDPGLMIGPTGGSIGDTWDGNTYSSPPPVIPSLEETQARKLESTWNYMKSAYEQAIVTVDIGANTYAFGCDQETRDNIIGINTAIAVGVAVPNPRNWMPKGEVVPISVTHTDLANIGAAILAKKDEYFQVYFTHKAAILTETDAATLLDYDEITGYNI